MEAEVTTNEQGDNVYDVPSPENMSLLDQLKSDPGFVDRYLNGDQDAMNEMSAAMKNQAPALSPPQEIDETINTTPEPESQGYQSAEEPGDREYHAEKEIQLNFGMLDDMENMDTSILHEANLEAKAIAQKYDVPDQMAQPFFNALAQNAASQMPWWW